LWPTFIQLTLGVSACVSVLHLDVVLLCLNYVVLDRLCVYQLACFVADFNLSHINPIASLGVPTTPGTAPFQHALLNRERAFRMFSGTCLV
jgi:hypothetical protein